MLKVSNLLKLLVHYDFTIVLTVTVETVALLFITCVSGCAVNKPIANQDNSVIAALIVTLVLPPAAAVPPK